MPPPKKLDLIPSELKKRLAETLMNRGFGDIVDVTEDLNFWLQEEGLEIRVGKSSVGEYSKLLKEQRDAFAMAETLLGDMDIEAESTMHKVLMQMIATAAFQMMNAVSEDDGEWDPKSLASLSRMLKDLMHSAGLREKLKEDERKRVAEEARAEERAAQASALEEGVSTGRINAEAAQAAREIMGFG